MGITLYTLLQSGIHLIVFVRMLFVSPLSCSSAISTPWTNVGGNRVYFIKFLATAKSYPLQSHLVYGSLYVTLHIECLFMTLKTFVQHIRLYTREQLYEKQENHFTNHINVNINSLLGKLKTYVCWCKCVTNLFFFIDGRAYVTEKRRYVT